VSSSLSHPRTGPLGLSPALAGAACCVVSALGYTAANICLRRLDVLHCDPAWAICNKELVSVLVVGPWLAVQALRGLPTLPWGRPLAILVAVGLATQLGGNVGVQWAFGIVGLAVMIPALNSFLLTSAAILGWVLLGERVSRRSAAAISLLLVALALLGIGAAGAGHSMAASPLEVTAAIGVAGLAGIIFALLSISIRHCVTGTTRLSAVVLIITGMGVLSLGPISACRLGMPQLLSTPPEHFAWMAGAGIFNLIAFSAISKALQLTTVVHVNMVNASQVALAAVAGIMIFGERPNPWLILGIALTIGGIFLFSRPADGQMVDQHV
jgi:drug/metabolite transporter, DME family